MYLSCQIIYYLFTKGPLGQTKHRPSPRSRCGVLEFNSPSTNTYAMPFSTPIRRPISGISLPLHSAIEAGSGDTYGPNFTQLIFYNTHIDIPLRQLIFHQFTKFSRRNKFMPPGCSSLLLSHRSAQVENQSQTRCERGNKIQVPV